VLLITLDQFRADCLSAAGHPVVRTPKLDELCTAGVRFARHYSQCSPCGPGRASLYTGMYQMNHRVVHNGTPLDARFDTIALAGRRAGYAPALFGYTDQSIDPRLADGPGDPRLSTYNGILPGFDDALYLPDEQTRWVDRLAQLGYDTSTGTDRLLATEHERPAEHSITAFLTDAAVEWIEAAARRRNADDGNGGNGANDAGQPWFAHLSYLRPHPPYTAAGEWSQAYDPADVGEPIAPHPDPEPFRDLVASLGVITAPADAGEMARIRAQYFGMIGHVDHQLGRLWDTLRATGDWERTLIVVTADHGEMLGDHGMMQKLGYWEPSYAIPCIVRDPAQPNGHGTVVERFTENVDVMPTVCEAIGVPVPAQCDGYPLTAYLRGEQPPWWRDAAHWEFDWRGYLIQHVGHHWPWDRTLERQHLATLRDNTHAYVQFGDGRAMCFDIAADPTWRTTTDDPAVMLPLAQAMLAWRSQHTDRTLADMLCADGGIGRLPDAWRAPPGDAGTPDHT
jgi:arylsulfatase A-like enzyme